MRNLWKFAQQNAKKQTAVIHLNGMKVLLKLDVVERQSKKKLSVLHDEEIIKFNFHNSSSSLGVSQTDKNCPK